MQSEKYQLISHALCPYVQRSIILLEEKGISYSRKDIDLAHKPAWFMQHSATGKVPLLIVDGKNSVFESAVICEYLDEVTAGSMLPNDHLEKAQHRSWIDFGSGILANIASLYNARDKIAFEKTHRQIQSKFHQLEEQLSPGPYFSGENFQLIDAVYAPIFRYFDVIDDFLFLDTFNTLDKCQRWRKALGQRQSVRHAVSIDYPVNLKHFLMKRESYLSIALQ